MRLDIPGKILQTAGIEPLAHVTVEETDFMLQLATRHEDVQLEYIQWLFGHAQSRV